MSQSPPTATPWLDLLRAVEPGLERDPAALGRAIRRWATLAAATHRADSVTAVIDAADARPELAEVVE